MDWMSVSQVMYTKMLYTKVVPNVIRTPAGRVDWSRMETSTLWVEQRLTCKPTDKWKTDAIEFFTDSMNSLQDYMEDEAVSQIHTQLEARLVDVRNHM